MQIDVPPGRPGENVVIRSSRPIVVPEDGMALSLPDDVVDITLCMPSGKRFRLSCHPDAEADSFEISEEIAEPDLTEILIHAWEPHGESDGGGFAWTYIHGGEETKEEFMAMASKAILDGAMTHPDIGGMSDFHYFIYGYAQSEWGADRVREAIENDEPWLAQGRLTEPYVVGRPLKTEPDPG